MRPPLTIEPDVAKNEAPRLDALLALPEWAASVIEYVETAAKAGEVVSVTSRHRTFTPAEAAERLGLSRATISRRIAAGEITTTKVGNRHRIAYDALERFWESMTAEMIDFYADDIAAELDGFADGRAQGRADRLVAEQLVDALRSPTRLGQRARYQREGVDVARSHHSEVSVVERRDDFDAQPFGDGHD